jgi:hypothetical protein
MEVGLLALEPVSETDAQSILIRLREAIDELTVELQRVQWRVAKLERQIGLPNTD